MYGSRQMQKAAIKFAIACRYKNNRSIKMKVDL